MKLIFTLFVIFMCCTGIGALLLSLGLLDFLKLASAVLLFSCFTAGLLFIVEWLTT